MGKSIEDDITDSVEWAERYASISDYESGIRELESAGKTAKEKGIALPEKASGIKKEMYTMKLSDELKDVRSLTEDNICISDIISVFGSRPSIDAIEECAKNAGVALGEDFLELKKQNYSIKLKKALEILKESPESLGSLYSMVVVDDIEKYSSFLNKSLPEEFLGMKKKIYRKEINWWITAHLKVEEFSGLSAVLSLEEQVKYQSSRGNVDFPKTQMDEIKRKCFDGLVKNLVSYASEKINDDEDSMVHYDCRSDNAIRYFDAVKEASLKFGYEIPKNALEAKEKAENLMVAGLTMRAEEYFSQKNYHYAGKYCNEAVAYCAERSLEEPKKAIQILSDLEKMFNKNRKR